MVEWILFVFVLGVCLVAIYYMHLVKEHMNIERTIDEASFKSQFDPTVFKIYDKSSAEHCDRFIVVFPFDWFIWVRNGEAYIVNPEGAITCGHKSTPAIQIFASKNKKLTTFLETCLQINLTAIIASYTSRLPKIVPYEIKGTTFTVLSALNILCRDGWIAFKTRDEPRGLSGKDVVEKTLKRALNFSELHKAYDDHVLHDHTSRR